MITDEKQYIDILYSMIEDGKSAPHLYCPTEFWKIGGQLIINEIKKKGLKNFRSHRYANRFFVPLYEKAYTKANSKIINRANFILKEIPYKNIGGDGDYKNFLNGYYDALTDYRVLCAAENNCKPILSNLSESTVGEPLEQFVFDGKNYSKSFLNYLLGLAFIKKKQDIADAFRIVEIGGGYGTLGEIFLKLNSNAFYIDIDLPPVALVATYYLSEIFGKDAVLSYDKSRDMETINANEISKEYKAMILCPWQLPKLTGKMDIFANFISFQEMEPEIIKNYIHQILRLSPKYILMRNLREGKEKKSKNNIAGVIEPMQLDEMINSFENYSLIDKDVRVFGEVKIDNFHSELAFLIKK